MKTGPKPVRSDEQELELLEEIGEQLKMGFKMKAIQDRLGVKKSYVWRLMNKHQWRKPC